MKKIIGIALLAGALGLPLAAHAGSDGAVGGAIAGGAAGAVVGGPVGAAVGAGVGGVAGGAASGPDHVVIEHRKAPPRESLGCSSTTTNRTNEFGDSTTTKRTDC